MGRVFERKAYRGILQQKKGFLCSLFHNSPSSAESSCSTFALRKKKNEKGKVPSYAEMLLAKKWLWPAFPNSFPFKSFPFLSLVQTRVWSSGLISNHKIFDETFSNAELGLIIWDFAFHSICSLSVENKSDPRRGGGSPRQQRTVSRGRVTKRLERIPGFRDGGPPSAWWPRAADDNLPGRKPGHRAVTWSLPAHTWAVRSSAGNATMFLLAKYPSPLLHRTCENLRWNVLVVAQKKGLSTTHTHNSNKCKHNQIPTKQRTPLTFFFSFFDWNFFTLDSPRFLWTKWTATDVLGWNQIEVRGPASKLLGMHGQIGVSTFTTRKRGLNKKEKEKIYTWCRENSTSDKCVSAIAVAFDFGPERPSF